MKKTVKQMVIASLAGLMLFVSAFTSYAEQWTSEEVVETDYDGSTYTVNKFYLLDDAGQKVLNREWEGGVLLADGELYIDELYVESDKINYWRNIYIAPSKNGIDESGIYSGTLDWKFQMLLQWKNTLKEEKGTYTMDFQLPSDWSEHCPSPLLTSAVDYVCFDKWGGWGYVNWTDAWSVDENNVIHMTATYY